MEFPLKHATYASQKKEWPTSGKHILAQFDDDSIIVYQAYNPLIAEAIVNSQNFHSIECQKSGYSMSRMTWIKTNFLWMMFRSGWATKPNQERILALRLRRDGFEMMLSKAVSSKTGGESSKGDGVRLQWDPDHHPSGGKHEERRAIQLGIRGSMLEMLSKEFLVSVYDITDFVTENRAFIRDFERLVVPCETIYPLSDDLKQSLDMI